MFSHFNNGIRGKLPDQEIDLPKLIKIIKNNPFKSEIENIRYLRSNGDDSYKNLKELLSYITPNCRVRERCLDKNPGDMEKNLIGFSQYVYFDIDGVSDAYKYKEYFIKKYGHQASMVSISSSCGGVSILFKISNTITVENFADIIMAIRTTILTDEKIDSKCTNIGRAMYVSSDPNVWVNYDNDIEVVLNDTETEENDINTKGKRVKQCKTSKKINNTLIYSFTAMPINEVLPLINIETQVEVANPIVDFKPREYTKIFIPKVIKDGTKHKTYTSMIHTLAYLNPNIEKNIIWSYLFYVNNRFARPKMEDKEFHRLFIFVYEDIKKTSITYCKTWTKYIHFNSNCGLSSKEKMKIANKLNGHYRRYKTIKRIQEAKQELQLLGIKATPKEVFNKSGLSLKTVRTHFYAEQIDMDWIIEQLNIPRITEENDISYEPTRSNFKNICRDVWVNNTFDNPRSPDTPRTNLNDTGESKGQPQYL